MSPIPRPEQARPERERLSDGARRRLLRALLDGTLVAGERLHDDDLTSWLGISRTPVRTALEQLSDLGLIEMAANRFTRIARPTPASHRAALEVYGALHAAIAHSVLPELSDDAVAALCTEAERVRAVAAEERITDAGAPVVSLWTRERLQEMGAITSFLSRRCANPILLSVVADIDLRLAFSFVSLAVPVDRAAVARCAEGVVEAAGQRSAAVFADAMEAFLETCMVGAGD